VRVRVKVKMRESVRKAGLISAPALELVLAHTQLIVRLKVRIRGYTDESRGSTAQRG
jgi:hypothetical protein